jgi:two-component system, response regulator PdtaR
VEKLVKQEPIVVLVVEDEPMVRALVVDVLEDAGCEVIESPTADHAVTVLEKRPDIRVVFTDVHMPGRLDGFQLARIVEDYHHHARVIVASGRRGPEPGDISPATRFIFKPYHTEKLVGAVRDAAALAGR